MSFGGKSYLTDILKICVFGRRNETFAQHTVQSVVCTHPQTVDTFKRISALLGLPLALAPALSARGVGGVGGCVRALGVGPTLNTGSIILQMHRKDTGDVQRCESHSLLMNISESKVLISNRLTCRSPAKQSFAPGI